MLPDCRTGSMMSLAPLPVTCVYYPVDPAKKWIHPCRVQDDLSYTWTFPNPYLLRNSMKRGTGGKEPGEHCWISFAIIGNGFQLLGKRHMAAVLGAQTQGETHRQNDTSLAGRPKDTNPYPWRDPYRGGGASRRLHKGGQPPSAAAPPLWIPLYGSLHGYKFVSLGRPASDVSFCLWVSPWV